MNWIEPSTLLKNSVNFHRWFLAWQGSAIASASSEASGSHPLEAPMEALPWHPPHRRSPMRAESSPKTAAIALLGAAAIACSPAAAPPRVVSLDPRGTRAIAALGLSDRLVAVDAESHAHAPAGLPTAALETALSHRPDVILVPPASADREAALEALRRSPAVVLEVGPHEFDEAFALYRAIAAACGDEARGRAAAHRIGDPLAHLSASRLGGARPLVAALVGLG